MSPTFVLLIFFYSGKCFRVNAPILSYCVFLVIKLFQNKGLSQHFFNDFNPDNINKVIFLDKVLVCLHGWNC